MRLPFSKIYRAFPELDRFSHEECERYVASVQYDLWYRRQSGLFFLGLIVVGPPSLWGLLQVLRPVLRGMHPAAIALSLTLFPILIALVLLMIRDRMLHRAIAARLVSATCRGCRYSLLGLTVSDGTVMCPECGAKIVLAEHNLKEEDLLVRRDAPASGPEGSS